MTKHQMPLLSEGQKQVLVTLGELELRRWASMPDKQYMVELITVALATLENQDRTADLISTPQHVLDAKYKEHFGLGQQGGWISCSERMPTKDECYLTWDGRFVDNTALVFGNWQVNNFLREKITHWQPLPAPPEMQEGRDGNTEGRAEAP